MKKMFITSIFGLTILWGSIDPVAGSLCQGIRSSFVQLNNRYTFPCNASICDQAEWRKVRPSDTTVASYQNQICRTRQAFHNDFTCEGSHLRLEAAKYTDRGTYMFICDRDEHSLILDVLYAINVNVTQMDNITLDCYHADGAHDVTWLYNSEPVVHYKKDGSTSTGKGFEGRVSVEKSCFNTGRFSLTITAVKQTDAGLYRCFLNDETTKGYPHTYKLHVKEKRSSPETDQTDSSCRHLFLFKTLTTVFGLLSVCVTSAFVVVHYKPTMLRFRTDGRHPVQESDPRDKPSSTRPFTYTQGM